MVSNAKRAPSLSAYLERVGPIDPDAMDYREARKRWREFRIVAGFKDDAPMLGDPTSNVKMAKDASGIVGIYGLSLAPADMTARELDRVPSALVDLVRSRLGSDFIGVDVCQWRTEACTAVCVLSTAGKGPIPNTRKSRIVRTLFAAYDPQAFITIVVGELRAAVARARAEYGPDARIGWRPNVAADLRFERFAPSVLSVDGTTTYDYTKGPARQRDASAYGRLVFSVSEAKHSTREAIEYLNAGGSAAVVFDTVKGRDLPSTWQGFDVIDGDLSDFRAADPTGVVVGLRAKGSGRGVVGSDDGFIKPGIAT